jgi:hypothetical protein
MTPELEARRNACRTEISQSNPGVLRVRSDKVALGLAKLLQVVADQSPIFVFLESLHSSSIKALSKESEALLSVVRHTQPNAHAPIVVGLSHIARSVRPEYQAALARQGINCVEETPEEFCHSIKGHLIEVAL